MKFFNKKIKEPSRGLTLILDVRSSSVGGVVMQFIKDGPSVILAAERDYFYFENSVKSSEFIARAEVSLNHVLEQLINKTSYSKPISSIEIFYGSPWYKTYIKNFISDDKKETVLTKDRFEEIIEKILKQENSQNIILEKDLISVTLNGYKTQNPFHKKTKKIELSLYLSILHKDTRKRFLKIISKYLNTRKIKGHTHPLSTFKVLNKIFFHEKNYVIFDISGEMTEITIIREEKIVKLISIPHGSNYFIRGLSKKCKYDFETAFLKLKLLSSKEVDPLCKKDSEKAFAKIKEEWFEIVKKALEEAKIQSMPHTFYVSTDQEVQELIDNILKDMGGYFETFKIGKKPVRHLLSSKSMENLCFYKNDNIKKDAQLSLWGSLVELTEDLN